MGDKNGASQSAIEESSCLSGWSRASDKSARQEAAMRTLIDILVWLVVLDVGWRVVQVDPLLTFAWVLMWIVLYCTVIPIVREKTK